MVEESELNYLMLDHAKERIVEVHPAEDVRFTQKISVMNVVIEDIMPVIVVALKGEDAGKYIILNEFETIIAYFIIYDFTYLVLLFTVKSYIILILRL